MTSFTISVNSLRMVLPSIIRLHRATESSLLLPTKSGALDLISPDLCVRKWVGGQADSKHAVVHVLSLIQELYVMRTELHVMKTNPVLKVWH